MDEVERSSLEKESNNTRYQNAIRCDEKQKAFIKNSKCGFFSLALVIKQGRSIFSAGLLKTENNMKTKLNS